MIKKKNLIITDNNLPYQYTDQEIVQFSTIKDWILKGKIFFKFKQYQNVHILCDNLPKYRRSLIFSLIAYFLKKNHSKITYANNQYLNISFKFILYRLCISIRDYLKKPFFKRKLYNQINTLKKNIPHNKPIIENGTPFYLRTDFHFSLIAGGSVGHIAGVLNNLEKVTKTPPTLLTSLKIPTVNKAITQRLVNPKDHFMELSDLPTLSFSSTYIKFVQKFFKKTPPSFIYERYSLGSIAGVSLSQQFGVPLILEYNGSEIWVTENWGKPLKQVKLFHGIEKLNLNGAALIVVVSHPLKESLVDMGIDEEKILVNPNGVDPKQYSPNIEGLLIRQKYNLENKTVIGFIGTFGKWHGAEVLVESFGKLIQKNSSKKIHLFMIGDGATIPLVKQLIEQYQLNNHVTLTGLVPQEKGPSYLAACDILVSPHVPNVDGSKFFGSPTKLFEYMAMGKGIIASDLEQIGEILDHEKTALVVTPGDQDELIQGMERLIDNPKLRDWLGTNARQEVIKNYTWEKHTHKIIHKLKELCPSA